MNPAFLLAMLLSLSPASPAPAQSTPVPERSKTLCTTLRENVRIALAGLMQNDALIETGRRAYHKMASDRASGSTGIASDRLYVENSVTALVHNLAQIDDLLADPKRFPVAGTSPDAIATAAMKQQLAAIAGDQRKTVNLLNGVLETANFNEAQSFNSDHPTGSRSSLSSAPGSSDLADGALSDDGGAYDSVASDIANLQEHAQTLESKAATSILAVAAQCTAGQY